MDAQEASDVVEEFSSRMTELFVVGRRRVASMLQAGSVLERVGLPAAVMLAIGVAMMLGVVVDGLMLPGRGMLVGVLAWFLLVPALGVPLVRLARRSVRRQAAEIARELELEQREARCPQCGAQVDIPGGLAVLQCASCSAELVAARGLVAEWTGEAERTVQVWTEQAQGVAARARERRAPVAAFLEGAWIPLLVAALALMTLASLALRAALA